MVRIVLRHDALICLDDKTLGRIEDVWHFRERYEPDPIAFVRRGVVRQAAVAALANRNAARTVTTDMARRVGVREVLRWTTVTAQRRGELIPVARAVQSEKRFQIDNVRI